MTALRDNGNEKLSIMAKTAEKLPKKAFNDISTFSITWRKIVIDTGEHVLVPEVFVKYK